VRPGWLGPGIGRVRAAVRRCQALAWPQWMDVDLGIVLGARLAMSTARAIAGVITALYLTAEGFSGVELGELFFCVTAASAAMSASVGLASDRLGRKPFLVAVPLLTAIAAAAYSVSRSPVVLFVSAAIGTLGRGSGAGGGTVGPYQPAESAFVAERVPGRVRAAAFGRMAFCSSLGALFGGLLAGLARPGPHPGAAAATAAYRPAFLAAGGLALMAGLIALGLRERPQAPRRQGRARWPRRSWPVIWRFWVTNGVNGVAIGTVGPFLSYWFYRRYGAGPETIGLLFAAVNLGALASTLSAAGIGRRLGTVPAIVAVRLATGLLLIPMVLAPTLWMAGAIYFIRMLAQRVGLPLRQSFTQDVADPEERASVAALSNLPSQGTMAASQVVAGFLFDAVGLAAPFELAALFQCANAILYAGLFGWHRPGRLQGKDASRLDDRASRRGR
jgi:MFS family permease